MSTKNISIVLLLAAVSAACEKVIDLDYKSNQSSVVIEGNITNEPGPYYVRITKSIALSKTIDYPTIDDATVTINDDEGNTDVLVPQGDGIYQTTSLTGAEGRTYTLTVEAEGKSYTAQSTMPQQVPFDSIKQERIEIGGDVQYNLIPVYTDPEEQGNNYRFILSVNSEPVNQHLIQNDEIQNGVVNALRLEINDNDLVLEPGDIVNAKMQCVDKRVGLYYTTLFLMVDSGPGGGTTPNNPPTNISNGALGLFSAHTVELKSLTIK